ncbi:hypothetical protein BU17DRAFT_88989 [Hysterangium stoloniferum]|nr:hypothetical protein BU17DRAFT_88989 [Hysterangium stoloniferum]
MALKRKLEVDIDVVVAAAHRPIKQLRIKHVESSSSTTSSDDIAMDDGCSISTAATGTESPSYPAFDLYPFPSYDSADVDMDAVTQTYNITTSDSRSSSNASQEASQNIGLLQPKSSFVHNV